MAVNRVDYNNNTLIDLTSDTVTAADLPAGVTAHDRSGTPITGTANYQPRTMDNSVTIGAETETTVEGAIGELADLVPSTAVPATNKLATAGDVSGEEIIVTSTTSPLATLAASPRKITIYGESEVVNGDIRSAGEGWVTVDLGTLEWTKSSDSDYFRASLPTLQPVSQSRTLPIICPKYITISDGRSYQNTPNNAIYTLTYTQTGSFVVVKTIDYTDAAVFKSAMSGVILAYPLADPTQGNTIAVKTDNTTGIDGTMAVLETGTPLRGISGGAQDIAVWDGVSGEVVKNCAGGELSGYSWTYDAENSQWITPDLAELAVHSATNPALICDRWTVQAYEELTEGGISWDNSGYLTCKTTDNTTEPLGEIIYQLATPTTTPFTATENASFAALRTYSPRTAISINNSPEFELEAYAGTANGKAVSEMEEKMQKQIEDKITVSSTLTLAANAWSNNTQTVTFAHDTTKRNVIDITPSDVPAWAAAGVYASSETSAVITFTCATVPETALTFKITSMEVN